MIEIDYTDKTIPALVRAEAWKNDEGADGLIANSLLVDVILEVGEARDKLQLVGAPEGVHLFCQVHWLADQIEGHACRDQRAQGDDGCGWCAQCCNEALERAEKAEESLADVKRVLESADCATYEARIAALLDEIEILKAERDAIKRKLDAVLAMIGPGPKPEFTSFEGGDFRIAYQKWKLREELAIQSREVVEDTP
jgi:uncharacterized small protein (DUF1192 family)